FIAALPFAAEWTSRCGQFTGLPEHARRLLDAERLLLVFPEGAAGTAKLFPERHSLVRFGSGFMRLALEARAPVVPVAFLGGGEAVPTIHNSYRLGRALGVPYVPFTPYGPPLPLPVRLDVLYGAPMHFEGDGSEHDDVIAAQVERVRARIGAMSDLGLAYRGGHIDEARLCSELRGAPT
ncbi:MAG: 1-acyl-sn-glycerol-3-phosphate acyltransferase, partial [Deltaproteobacteria bacterium]|nr:1-acyl-sn-glycerol-3-phosphate acyltransferase [Deltaproteobacteria bacterium]